MTDSYLNYMKNTSHRTPRNLNTHGDLVSSLPATTSSNGTTTTTTTAMSTGHDTVDSNLRPSPKSASAMFKLLKASNGSSTSDMNDNSELSDRYYQVGLIQVFSFLAFRCQENLHFQAFFETKTPYQHQVVQVYEPYLKI
jgi:hypothetical protein